MPKEIEDVAFKNLKQQVALTAAGKVNSSLLGMTIIALFKLSNDEQKQIMRDTIKQIKENTFNDILAASKTAFKLTIEQEEELMEVIFKITNDNLSQIEAVMDNY